MEFERLSGTLKISCSQLKWARAERNLAITVTLAGLASTVAIDPLGLEIAGPRGWNNPSWRPPGVKLVNDFHDKRREGHQRYPGEENSPTRHCVISRESSQVYDLNVYDSKERFLFQLYCEPTVKQVRLGRTEYH
jgi:hypothetical protein